MFAVCCAYTAVLLGFEIYIISEISSDPFQNTATAVVMSLIEGVNLTKSQGHVLYTNNWYTSIMFVKIFLKNMDGNSVELKL